MDEPCQGCIERTRYQDFNDRVTALEAERDRRAFARAFLFLAVMLAFYAWQAGWIRLDLPVRGA